MKYRVTPEALKLPTTTILLLLFLLLLYKAIQMPSTSSRVPTCLEMVSVDPISEPLLKLIVISVVVFPIVDDQFSLVKCRPRRSTRFLMFSKISPALIGRDRVQPDAIVNDLNYDQKFKRVPNTRFSISFTIPVHVEPQSRFPQGFKLLLTRIEYSIKPRHPIID